MATLDTDINLNQSPYYSDFNESDQYYNILFKPSTPVQTRELNVMQQMIQDQMANFANSVFTPGTIISGCKLTYSNNYPYVKILDTYANNTALTVSSLVNNYLISNSGLQAYIINSVQGYVAASPNLNTLYIKYINSAVNASTNSVISVFQNDEVLNVVTSANISLGYITVANTISSGNSNTTGSGCTVTVGDGIIFQKGLMLTVNKTSVIVDNYDNQPNNVSVGFVSTESISTSLQDTKLLDNSQGSPNYNAPGADRLKIVPKLVTTVTSAVNTNSNNFFSVIDFVNGNPSYINQDVSYLGSSLGNQLAKTSFDTNGNFVISPFTLSASQYIDANGAYDANIINITVTSGTGYINGNKVQLIGQVETQINKGNQVLVANSQIVTAQYGNYLPVQEFAGMFDPTQLTLVYLTNSPAYSVSNVISKGISLNSTTASGTVIGTAYVIATRYISGTLNTNTAQYYLYLFNVSMYNGYNFSSVRSVFANSGGAVGCADVITYGNNAILQNPSFSPLIYDFNQSAVKTLLNSSNTIDTQFTYVKSTGVTILNNGTASITIPSYIGGTNELPFGVGYLNNTQESGFIVVSEGSALSINIGAGASVSSGNVTVTVANTSNGLYVGALLELGNGTSSQIRQIASITNATSVNVTSAFTTTYSGANIAIAYVPGQIIPISNIYISSSTGFTLNLPQGLAGTTTLSANVIYNILRTNASSAKKDLQGTTYVQINCSNNVGGTTGPWCLGFPDVLQILNVWVGTTASNTNPNLANNFTLVNGQNDQYYGLSMMYSNNAVLSSSSVILVELAAFQPDFSSGAGFYSIDSYPINDFVNGIQANTLNTADILSYDSIASQSNYFLRNCVDFRPYAKPTASYANTAVGATINPSATLSMNTTSIFLPVPDSTFESSLQYYMGRYDVIGLSNTGQIIINTGNPSENPVPPGDIVNGMTLATINVPPYPTLTSDISNSFDNPACPTVTFNYNTNKVYTMKDIGDLDERLKVVEYYTSLSLLEQSAQNLLLTSASGQNRFQNGILADSFADYSVANLNALGFNISIDPDSTLAAPYFSQTPIPLVYISNTGNTVVSSDGRFITLGWSEIATPFISQTFATEEINASQDILFVYQGTIVLKPTGDYKPDVTILPSVVTNSNVYTGSTSALVKNGQNETTTTTNTSVSKISFKNIGNLSIQEYMPKQIIKFSAFGLKPSTQHWVWFGGTPVTQYCAPTNSSFGFITNSQTNPGLFPLVTDSTGALYGRFFVPGGIFHAATLVMQILDISNLATQNAIITSSAFTSFFGTNIAYTEQKVTIKTVTQETVINNSTTIINNNTTVNNNIIIANSSQGAHGGGNAGAGADPIAQSFYIDPNAIPSGCDGVFVTSVDFYFATKDANLGITLQIQEMDSAGEISNLIVNDSKVHLWPSSINVDPNTGATATTFTFPAPLLLQTGLYYAFILKPDGSNPNYNLWAAKIGDKDVVTGAPVALLSGTGIIFTSSMGETWSPVQNESLKFNLRIASFNYTQGTANLYNQDLEFFNTNNFVGNFQNGEVINFSNTLLSNANASVTINSKNVLANTSLYTNNTIVAILSPINQTSDVVLITGISSGQQFTVNTAISFTDPGATVYNVNPITGTLYSVNSSMMFVTNSTSNTSYYLSNSANYYAIGQFSGAYCNAALVDIHLDNIMSKLGVAVPTVTSMGYSYNGVSNTYVVDANTTALTFGTSSDLFYERVVMSKSNEGRFLSGNKSLTISANLQTTTSYVSPVIDTEKMDAWTVFNLINSDPGSYFLGEVNGVTNAINRYVSTTVNLSAGLNGEDLVVYVGAYYPPGSQIYVYARIRNQYDSEAWETKAWSPMYTNNTIRSSLTNFLDYNEYQYNFGQTNATATAAFDNPANNYVASYYTNAGNLLGEFNQFAIKIVLTGTNSATPPLLTDFRAVTVASSD